MESGGIMNAALAETVVEDARLKSSEHQPV